MTNLEKRFARNVMRLSLEYASCEVETKDKEYLALNKKHLIFYRKAAPVVAEHYSTCYRYVLSHKKEILKYSDSKIGKIKMREIHGIGSWLGSPEEVYWNLDTQLRALGFSNVYFETFINHNYPAEYDKSFFNYKNEKSSKPKFKVLCRALTKAGLEKNIAKRFEMALNQINGLLDCFLRNYSDVSRGKNLGEIHRAFRELNYSFYVLTGCKYRWYPLFWYVTSHPKMRAKFPRK